MKSETNRIEYKLQLTDDLEKESIKTGTPIGVVDVDGEMNRQELQEKLNLSDQEYFRLYYLK